MSASTDLIYDIKRKMLAKYPRFGSEIAVAIGASRWTSPFELWAEKTGHVKDFRL